MDRAARAETAPSPPASPAQRRSSKAENVRRRRSLFEGVRAEFDVDLENLRDAYVNWQGVLRRRRKNRNPIARLRFDFPPELERIYEAYSLGRQIHLHRLALPTLFLCFFLLCVFETAVDIAILPPNMSLLYNRIATTVVLLGFLIVTRYSRWKHSRAVHLGTLCLSFLAVAQAITYAEVVNHDLNDGGLASNLVTFGCFLLVDTSFSWQLATGISCALMEILFLYAVHNYNYPSSFVYAISISSFLTILGGSAYLYMCIRLARKLFLDQVLARLQEYQLVREKDRLEGLLHVILPKAIAARLTAGEQPISDRFEDATVMFVEIVGFESTVAATSPLHAVKLLNKLYSRFDAVCEKNYVMRIKIIGTSYMAISGIPSVRQQHTELACTTALALTEELGRFCAEHGIRLGFKLGINRGPLVAGVIGVQKFCYDVWGDTVNTAARMCSHAGLGVIQVTAGVRERAEATFEFVQLDEAMIKGKGLMVNYQLKAKRTLIGRRDSPAVSLNLAPLPPVDLTRHSSNSSMAASAPPLSPLTAHAKFMGGSSSEESDDDDRPLLATSARPPLAPRRLEPVVADKPVVEDETTSLTRSRQRSQKRRSGSFGTVDALLSITGMDFSTKTTQDMNSNATGDTLTLPTSPRKEILNLTRYESNLSLDESYEAPMEGSNDFSTSDSRGRLFRSASINTTAPVSPRIGGYQSLRRDTDKDAAIDFSRSQHVQRNLAAAFGFDGVSAEEKEHAEAERYAVTTRCCFLRFTARGMEETFDARSVQEAKGFVRVIYVWCLFLVLSGMLYDYLAIHTAPVVREVFPLAYPPAAREVPGLVFLNPWVTLWLLVGVRLALSLPLVAIIALTYTSRAVQLIPYMSLFAVWWVFAADLVCIYMAAPAELLMITSRMVAVTGSLQMIMRGLNVQRQLVSCVVGLFLVAGGIYVVNTYQVWLISIVSYTVPQLIVALMLRSRLQVSQRTYFIERIKVARRNKEITLHHEKADKILLNIFPKTIYDRIKRGERDIVDVHRAAVVLFADVVGFTQMSTEYTPGEIVDTLNEIFCAFDALMGKYHLEKVKTIGDCFVCSAGVSTINIAPITSMVNCALEMVGIMQNIRSVRGQVIEMRWGIHCGDVISAVVGEKRFLYDIFGDAVHTASRMEAASAAGRVLVSEPVAVVLRKSGYELKEHIMVQTHAGGLINTHFVLGKEGTAATTKREGEVDAAPAVANSLPSGGKGRPTSWGSDGGADAGIATTADALYRL